uniref:Minor structural protein n=1 Tax=Rabbit hemorrhagic disease virus TaxID=11976 RepID=A0A1B2RWU3_RHDV|nr:minor structural protein [Rabbit hemorrhagic disease virus]AOC59379.1 minor structural protein [Rabbit hemorrhagic disease virus]
MSEFIGLGLAGAGVLSNALLRRQELQLQKQALENGLVLKADQLGRLGFNPNEVKNVIVGNSFGIRLSNMHNDASVVNAYNVYNPASNGIRKKIKSFNNSVKIYNTTGESSA